MTMQFEKPTLQEVENFMKEFIEQNKEKYSKYENFEKLDPVIIAGDFYYYEESCSWCNPVCKPLPAWQPAAKHYVLHSLVCGNDYETVVMEQSEEWKEYEKTTGDTFLDLFYEEDNIETAMLKRKADQILKLFNYELTPSNKLFLINLILQNNQVKIVRDYVEREVNKALKKKEFTVVIQEKAQ